MGSLAQTMEAGARVRTLRPQAPFYRNSAIFLLPSGRRWREASDEGLTFDNSSATYRAHSSKVRPSSACRHLLPTGSRWLICLSGRLWTGCPRSRKSLRCFGGGSGGLLGLLGGALLRLLAG